MKKYLAVFLVLMTGCSTLQVTNKMPLVGKGMTKQEIHSLLGNPSRYGGITKDESGKENETWIYEERTDQGFGKSIAKFFLYVFSFGGYYFVDTMYGRKDFNVYEFKFIDGVLESMRSQKGEQSPGFVFGVNFNQTQVNPIQ